ncbi:MAG: radical SAM protein [Bacilli bacterium]|nr:radical SAM protein [Bacilli bacterium]
MGKEIISVCYEVNKECNLKCDYCITSDNENNKIDYKMIIKYIVSLNPKRIVISGGEPLLDPDLIKKLAVLRELCPDSYISLSTNGTVKYDYNLINKYVDCIDVSLPSLSSDVYELMRGRNLLSNVKENLEDLKELDIDLRLSFMLTRVNKDEIFDFLAYAESLNVKEVRIGRYFPFRGGNKYSFKYELSQDEIDLVVSKINKEDYPFKIVLPIGNLQLMSDSYLTINHMGQVSTPTYDGKNILLEINEDTNNDVDLNIGNQNDIFEKVLLKNNCKRTNNK